MDGPAQAPLALGSPLALTSDLLDAVPHGFFTRPGGVSTGLYAGLNCGLGSRDARERVLENRALAAAHLNLEADRLVNVHQVHGRDVAIVTEPWAPGAGPAADALVTERPGIGLGVLTADCAPVLLVDPEAEVVGAAHAGWKGALAGVTDAAVEAMASLGARRERILAAVGPCIARGSYEVGDELLAAFLAADPANAAHFDAGARPGHWQFDLAAYVLERLWAAGIAGAHALGQDTYAEDALFFSFRRTTHRGEPDYGRQISAIALPG
jgi:YfiH family protein